MAETHPVIQRLSLRMYCNAACFGSFSIAAPQEIAASSPSVACQCALCWRDSFPPETMDQPRKKTRARCVQGRDGLRAPVSMALRRTASGTQWLCAAVRERQFEIFRLG